MKKLNWNRFLWVAAILILVLFLMKLANLVGLDV